MSVATYEEVKSISNQSDKYLIDVRNPDELAKTGTLPCSINIPMPQLESALKMSANDFKTAFNRDMPKADAVLIFSCMAGGRAKRATDLAQSHGFKKAKCYSGSWTEWAKKEGL